MGGLLITLGGEQNTAAQKLKSGTLNRVLTIAVPYWRSFGLLILIAILEVAVSISTPLLYRDIIDSGVLKQNADKVVDLALCVLALGILGGAIGLAQTFLSTRLGACIALSLRARLFSHIQRLSIAFFTNVQTGSLVSRINSDADNAGTALAETLWNVISNLLIVIFTVCAMAMLSWRVALVAVSLLPLVVFPARYYRRKLEAIAREGFELHALMSSFMIERLNVAGALLSMLFNGTHSDAKSFEAYAARASDVSVKSAVFFRLFLVTLLLITSIATAFAYGWGGLKVIEHTLDLGTLVAIAAYLTQLYGPLLGLSSIQSNIITALVAFERTFEVLDIEPVVCDSSDAIHLSSGVKTISFDNVSFRYPKASEASLASLEPISVQDGSIAETVLHDISFSVGPGQMVALVGLSGAGKTTIAHLIARLYDVINGSISINGVDVRSVSLHSLRQCIGIVTQDTHLLHDTIRANLLYAKPTATEAEMFDAIQAAQLYSQVSSLPLGLDTLVGERGYRFSGGEKQRLAIARLLIKAPDIVILDEATAHLDSESEIAIQWALDHALAGRTSLVIAHRLSTIKKADQILFIQDGRIRERGTHSELLAKRGRYAELYQAQFSAHSCL